MEKLNPYTFKFDHHSPMRLMLPTGAIIRIQTSKSNFYYEVVESTDTSVSYVIRKVTNRRDSRKSHLSPSFFDTLDFTPKETDSND